MSKAALVGISTLLDALRYPRSADFELEGEIACIDIGVVIATIGASPS